MKLRPALLLLALLAVAISAVPSPAAAGGDRSARRLRRSALAHYRNGDYADAARDFRAAYEIEADAELLYALGQSLRLAGDCAGAIDAYQDFLVTGPEEEQASAAREKIDVCRQVLAPTTPPAPAPAPRPAPRSLAPPRSPAPPSKSWARDPAGGLLLAGGVAAAATGIWLVGDADGGADDPAHGQRTAGAVLLGVGGGLVAAAVIRYALVRRDRRDDDAPPVSAAIDPGGGAALWVTGRF